MRDEELAAAGVHPTERHADGAAQIRQLVQLDPDRVPGTALAVTPGIPVLNHEVGHDAMNVEAVEEPLPREADEVFDRERGIEYGQLDLNRAPIGVDVHVRRHQRVFYPRLLLPLCPGT